jgi:hypothetical protein
MHASPKHGVGTQAATTPPNALELDSRPHLFSEAPCPETLYDGLGSRMTTTPTAASRSINCSTVHPTHRVGFASAVPNCANVVLANSGGFTTTEAHSINTGGSLRRHSTRRIPQISAIRQEAGRLALQKLHAIQINQGKWVGQVLDFNRIRSALHASVSKVHRIAASKCPAFNAE